MGPGGLWERLRKHCVDIAGDARFHMDLTESVNGAQYTGWYFEARLWSPYPDCQTVIIENQPPEPTPAEAIVNAFLVVANEAHDAR
jgi:hypothetical protein